MFDFISSWIEAGGAIAVAALMLLENVFPPIPSELVMPMAGYLAATGSLGVLAIFLGGVAGSVAGAWLWYWAAIRLGRVRLLDWIGAHGHWLTLTRADVEGALRWFHRHRDWGVFLGRMVPGVRTLISVPAGLDGMGLGRFLALTTAGSAVWVALLTGAGYVLEAQYERVQGWLNPVTNVILGGLVLWYLWRVFAIWRGKKDV